MARPDWYCEDVLSGKMEIRKVWQDERVLAFHHPQPAGEIHIVVIPKAHVPSILDATALDGALLTSMVVRSRRWRGLFVWMRLDSTSAPTPRRPA